MNEHFIVFLVHLFKSNLILDETKTLFLKLTKYHIDYLNEATINTANYFVISNESFTLSQNTYIYNRFNNPEWNFRKPHFYL
ncbi:hypothetical protein HMPREF9318_00916 [Streptococcus urinalis FB127-CNA-2]|nr:hypothetical protein HMPREF9318_00916 [Streptococcus urinalis FB127-CNA-2]VEF30971.1 Uncharacterised protein [Streptococcus urinalis]